MSILIFTIYLSIIFITFILMEGVAWFLHKYFMHGLGWFLHEDYHRSSESRFEKNDIFGLFFAILSFLLILTGFLSGFDIRLAI